MVLNLSLGQRNPRHNGTDLSKPDAMMGSTPKATPMVAPG